MNKVNFKKIMLINRKKIMKFGLNVNISKSADFLLRRSFFLLRNGCLDQIYYSAKNEF